MSESNTLADAEIEVEPTDEELARLERVGDRIPWTVWLIVICEFCERFAFIGLSGPFQNYIQFPIAGPNDQQPGALGRGHRMATLVITCFQFLCYFTPIGGAMLADQYWGKYKTISIACFIYTIGLFVLVLTSTPYSIRMGIAFPGLLIAMGILALATGGLKSNVSPLMAQQYTRTKPVVRNINGKKKIIDPKITFQSMFTWFYWVINFGSLASTISTNVEKYASYWLAFLIPMTVFTGCILVLIIGRRRYIRIPPRGSMLLRAIRVMFTAIRMRCRLGQRAKEKLLPINEQDTDDENQFIDDLKQACRACRVFVFYPFFWVCSIQIGGNMISQAAQMDVGPFPNDVFQNIDGFVTILLVPVVEKGLYPLLRRWNIQFNMIRRITCGFLCASFAMGWTGFVQHRIYSTGPNYDYSTKPCDTCQKFNNISAAWQIPSYVIMAIGEIFTAATGLEYAFTQAPESMKSIVVSLFLFTTGVGSALNFTLLPVLVDPKIQWMFVSLSIMALVIGLTFFLLFRHDRERNSSP